MTAIMTGKIKTDSLFKGRTTNISLNGPQATPKTKRSGLPAHPFGGSEPVFCPDQQPEVEATDMNQVAFLNVFTS
jgi:hypothetical protein